jgi:hypothetical protein
MSGVVGLAVVLFIAWCLCSKGSAAPSRAVRAHVHATGSVRVAARHEGGHGAVGRHVGGRIGSARVNPDGSGWIYVHPRGRDFTPAERIAISLAGGMAEGVSMSSRQCSGDQRNIDAVLDRVPSQNRGAVMSEARRLARSGLFWQGGTASDIARRLERHGQI